MKDEQVKPSSEQSSDAENADSSPEKPETVETPDKEVSPDKPETVETSAEEISPDKPETVETPVEEVSAEKPEPVETPVGEVSTEKSETVETLSKEISPDKPETVETPTRGYATEKPVTVETPAEEITPEKPDIVKAADEDDSIKDQTPQPLMPVPEPELEFEEIILDLEDVPIEDGYSPEEREAMESRYAETMKEFRHGELVIGKVVAITDGEIAVDIGFKSEGNIPVEEFEDVDKIKVGDEVEVLIDSIEDDEGTLLLSKRKAEFKRVWEKINDLYQSGEMVEAPIVRRIKGGMVVDLYNVEAFLPGSQIDVHPVRDFDALVGMSMDFRIIKVNNARKNVVLSHKVLVEESLREIREKVLAEIEEGQVVEGIVKNVTDFGVFVDLGGVDGLLHITDLSWGRVSHPSDVVTLDEKIKVKVLRYDKEKQRISLGLKQLKEHHWDEIEKKFALNAKVKGKVVSLVKYGAFIELEEGVEGLVHISEMSWTQHIKHPSQILSVNDEIDVVVLNIDRESRKISLGIKQCEEDPWERLEKTFIIGSRHKGIVRDLVPFGAFVELEQNIDGLIHISDLSWVRKVRHPGEIVKKGEEIEVVVLNFDRNERRIALGLKQVEADPWNSFEKEYPIRSRSEGSVVRVLEKGVVVMLPMGVEGFIPNSQLGKSISGENKRKIQEGDNLSLEVIEFDKINHRIVLSHQLVERERDRSTFRTYRDTSDSKKATIGDLIRENEKESGKKLVPSLAKTKKPPQPKAKKAEAVKEEEAEAKAETIEKTTQPDKTKAPADTKKKTKPPITDSKKETEQIPIEDEKAPVAEKATEQVETETIKEEEKKTPEESIEVKLETEPTKVEDKESKAADKEPEDSEAPSIQEEVSEEKPAAEPDESAAVTVSTEADKKPEPEKPEVVTEVSEQVPEVKKARKKASKEKPDSDAKPTRKKKVTTNKAKKDSVKVKADAAGEAEQIEKNSEAEPTDDADEKTE